MRNRYILVERTAPRRRHYAAAPVWWLGGLCALCAGGWSAGLRLNLTESLPVGLYRLERRAPERGAIVLVCLPPSIAVFAHARGYVPQGGQCADRTVPIGKIVMAMPGDTVRVTRAGVQVNGVLLPKSRPLIRDRHGRPLPIPPFGLHRVAQGERWVFAPSPVSYDSRYFGPIRVSSIVAVVHPMWTLHPTH